MKSQSLPLCQAKKNKTRRQRSYRLVHAAWFSIHSIRSNCTNQLFLLLYRDLEHLFD